jgi:hypothetical protein
MAGNLTAMIASIFSGSAVTADPYYEYTTLLLPGNGTNGAQNNTFLDGSTNNFTITRNGNTTQGTFSPFSQTGWGNYFDGSGDYLSAANNTAFDFGTGDFTVECWLYYVSVSTDHAIISRYATTIGWALRYTTTTGFQFSNGDTNLVNKVVTPTNGQWYHLAVSRQGTNLRLFINGDLSATATDSTSLSSSTTLYVNRLSSAVSWEKNCYISNVRIVKGTAVYTAAFTPPTAPLSAITNTSLLTCQSNRFIDNSSNNFTITRNGDTRVVAFSPFNPTASWSAATYGGSGYFDGSGDYLSVADNANLRFGTSAFTIQAWIYRNASGTAHSIIAKGGASTGYVLQVTSTNVLRFTHGTTNVDTTTTIPASAWTHVAAVRTNTSTNGFQLYINGVSSATATVSTDFNQTDTLYIGGDRSAANVMNGYISGLKYTNGTAETISVPTEPPTATTNVALLTNFTNAGIYDATSKNDLETVGNAQISTAISAKWGSGSMYFDGTGDTLTIPSSVLTTLATGDFTLEAWFYLSVNATNSLIYGNGPWAANKWALHTNGSSQVNKLSFFVNNISSTAATMAGTTTLSTGVWYHVAVTRSGTTFRLFLNGTQEASTTSSASIDGGVATTTYVGSDSSLASTFFNGYMQDLRLTKGYARYTANFTPPTAAFPTL